MLTIRRRGAVWHARGTVKAAGRRFYLQECTTHETEEQAARKWARRRETEIENDLREGRDPDPAPALSFLDAVDALTDARAFTVRDRGFLARLVEHFGDAALAALTPQNWDEFVRLKLKSQPAPSTVDRYLYMFRTVFASARLAMPEIDSPRTKAARRQEMRARWLTPHDADRAIACYRERGHARRIATVLRYQGFRTQEALQLDRRFIDMDRVTPTGRGAIGVGKSKNGFEREVAMHPRVREAIGPLMLGPQRRFALEDGGDIEPLFLSQWGEPYRDTRGEGGNPFKHAHQNAMTRAGIADFTPHDWRRHWACWMLKLGADVYTLMRLGGWTDLASIEPYIQAAAGDMGRQHEALARVA